MEGGFLSLWVVILIYSGFSVFLFVEEKAYRCLPYTLFISFSIIYYYIFEFVIVLSFWSAQEVKVDYYGGDFSHFLFCIGNIGVSCYVSAHVSLNIFSVSHEKMSKKLTDFLQNYINKQSLFKDKKALQQNYTPRNVPYRSEQIQQIASILAPALRMEKPSNIFIYGKTGTGKTLITKHVAHDIIHIAKENHINLKIFYLNCKLKRVADTEYRLIAQLARDFGENVPATGLPTDEIYKIFIKGLDDKKLLLLIILDEIDQLVKKIGDGILYNLTRLNSELKNSEISIIGISNDLMFADHIDPRVKSSLSEEECVFPPYNAVQLQKILWQRAKLAFHEGVIGDGVIEKCAAYAAREHGDARRALELLRVAGELAERSGDQAIAEKYIDKAEEKIERDKVYDIIVTQPKQFKLSLLSIFTLCGAQATEEKSHIFTGDVYEIYKNLCVTCGIKPLTQRRLSDIVGELDMLGIINAKVVNKGRYGRTREISLAIPHSTVENLNTVLKEGLGL